jgi:hypothetical protein
MGFGATTVSEPNDVKWLHMHTSNVGVEFL